MAALATVDDEETRSSRDGGPTNGTASLYERADLGKAARKRMARSEHGDWIPPSERRSPVEILAAQDASRVRDLVPVRYGRMLDSPFTFYRGAAAIMAA